MNSTKQLVAQFWLNGRGLGKARARKTSQHTKMHLPAKYAKWKDRAILSIRIQMLDLAPAPKPIEVECLFVNFATSDADNLIGAVKDALVQAQYIQNDSSSFVVGCSGRFAKARKRRNAPLERGILVNVYESAPVELSAGIADGFRAKFPQLFEEKVSNRLLASLAKSK